MLESTIPNSTKASLEQQNKRIKLNHTQDSIVQVQTDNDDDEDMFGDDIALEELENISALMPVIAAPTFIPTSTITRREPTPMPMMTEAPIRTKIQQQENSMDTDLFGDELPLDELDNVLTMAESSMQVDPPVPPEPKERKKFIRYLVSHIATTRYVEDDIELEEKQVLLIQEDRKGMIKARLRQDWKQTTIAPGNVVHLPTSNSNQFDEVIVDNRHNFIIVQPDRLVSCTAIADSFVCLRKSVLQSKVRGASEYTEALVHGNIIHRVLQEALQQDDFKVDSIHATMHRVVMNSIEDLYAMDQDEQTALDILGEYAESISQFGSKYVNKYPKPTATPCTDMGMDPTKELDFETLAISEVLDIEEHLWSATYGIKGMVDATIQLRLSKSNKLLAVPFELKTGKTSRFLTNRAQTLLYTLLMSDRYDVDISAGVLYYSKTNTLYLVPSSHNDLRSLIMARNALAVAFGNRGRIPEMIRDSHTCQHCFVSDACHVYHKAVEKGTGVTSGLYQLFEDKTNHMTPKACNFFEHWWKLLDQEEVDIDYIRKDMWSQPADIRERMGRCLSNMALDLASCDINPTTNQWHYTFKRHGSRTQEVALSSTMAVNDPVVVSSMDGHINLAMGYVSHISKYEISINFTEPLRNPPQTATGFDPKHRQAFKPFVQHINAESIYANSDIKYRIDKDDMAIGMAMLRNNLVLLITKSERLGQLIIEKAKPLYRSETPALPPTCKLNTDQKKALKKVLQAEDYTLILGMPGTGKTTTTAQIIQHLVELGKSVLVAAYTHTALDNVLSKLRQNGVDVLRLGNIQKVMPSMRDCVPVANDKVTSVDAMRSLYDSKRVVGVTCLGINEVLLQKRSFDYCIIDEASQITLPTCIGPLRYADKFVLVGDLYQLPPIVRSKEACEGGLDKSLFSILAEARPESICYLEYQYRMCRDIMEVSNMLIYGGKLKCGNHRTATRELELPQLEAGMTVLHQNLHQLCQGSDSCWLRQLMDPRRKVIFMNTDNLNAKESRPFGSFLQNDMEAKLINQAAEAMMRCGVTEDQLAIISVYRSQLRVISQQLRHRSNIEIATIDKYQGRDKDCVLISLVRNNAAGNSGDLLRDWHRINVAMTRAKSKLVLFGSASTLKASALYCDVLGMFEKNGWMIDLVEGVDVSHELQKENIQPRLPSSAKSTKAFFPTPAILKKNDILKDIYTNSTC